jgi:hypothetical protein
MCVEDGRQPAPQRTRTEKSVVTLVGSWWPATLVYFGIALHNLAWHLDHLDQVTRWHCSSALEQDDVDSGALVA